MTLNRCVLWDLAHPGDLSPGFGLPVSRPSRLGPRLV